MHKLDKVTMGKISKEKAHEIYASAWIATRLEGSRQVITVSTVSLGFLGIFYPKIEGDLIAYVLWDGAGAAFIAAIALMLWVLRKNADLADVLINGASDVERKSHDKAIRKLANGSRLGFAIGIALMALLALYLSGQLSCIAQLLGIISKACICFTA